MFSTLADVARRIPQIDKHEVPREKGRADAEPDKNGKEQANKPNLSAQTLSKMSDLETMSKLKRQDHFNENQFSYKLETGIV